MDSLSTKNRKPGTLFRISCHHRANVFFVRICCSYMFESGPAGNWGCFSSIQSREQQTLLCKTGVVLVVVSCLPGFGRLSGSLTLVRQYRSSSSSSFCCKGEGQHGRLKTYLLWQIQIQIKYTRKQKYPAFVFGGFTLPSEVR